MQYARIIHSKSRHYDTTYLCKDRPIQSSRQTIGIKTSMDDRKDFVAQSLFSSCNVSLLSIGRYQLIP